MGRPTDVHPVGCASRLPRFLRRPSVRGVCAVGVLALVGSLAGGTSASAQVDALAAASTQSVAAHDVSRPAVQAAPHAAAGQPGVPAASPEAGSSADRSSGAASSRSDSRSDDVVGELETQLADPILMIAGPSSSHGLSFQEGDPEYPLPFDGFLDDHVAKVVRTEGSGERSAKSKASRSDLSGAQPHPPVNQLPPSRVQLAYESHHHAQPNNGLAMRAGFARDKLLSQPAAPRRAGASMVSGDGTSSAGANAGEDDLAGDPALRSLSTAIGRLFSWYVPASGTNPLAVRANPDEPSFSPD